MVNLELELGIPMLVKLGIIEPTGQTKKMKAGEPPEPCYNMTQEFISYYMDMMINQFGVPGHVEELEIKYSIKSRDAITHGLLTSIEAVKRFVEMKGGEQLDDHDLELSGRIVESFLKLNGLGRGQ